ncbi:MAG: 3-deoxy-8-phosphooctulonate synthase [Verrucomicrobiae bacterium]|nr:3-deoxy-8-phosphooctulonate synthase [Verrucomicrobiae bacterium]
MAQLAFDRFFLIAGPCAVESRALCLRVARELARLGRAHRLPVVFKASYDKANRSSHRSFRGPGLRRGLEWLRAVKEETGLPVLTDLHLPSEAESAAEVADVLQIPAFLCRQTDLLVAAAKTGRWVNVKKGQFLAPEEMGNVVAKLRHAGARGRTLLTERGACFGYGNLVVDFRSIPILRSFGCPVVFDATHSVQRPGGLGDRSGGDARFIPTLARAATAAGCDGLFVETHPDPSRALSDGPNMIRLRDLPRLVTEVLRVRAAVG